ATNPVAGRHKGRPGAARPGRLGRGRAGGERGCPPGGRAPLLRVSEPGRGGLLGDNRSPPDDDHRPAPREINRGRPGRPGRLLFGMNPMNSRIRPTKETTHSDPVPLPEGPNTQSPVPTLTSIHATPGRGPYGDPAYRGNCSGLVIRDLLRFYAATR